MKEAPLRDRLGEALVRENNLIAENAKLRAALGRIARGEANEIAIARAGFANEETKLETLDFALMLNEQAAEIERLRAALTDKQTIQRGIFAALGHVKFDYRSPKQLDETAGVIADFVIAALNEETK